MGETVGVLIPLQVQESVLYFYSFPEKQFSIKDGLKQIGTLMRKTCFSVDQGASVGMRHFPREETLSWERCCGAFDYRWKRALALTFAPSELHLGLLALAEKTAPSCGWRARQQAMIPAQKSNSTFPQASLNAWGTGPPLLSALWEGPWRVHIQTPSVISRYNKNIF